MIYDSFQDLLAAYENLEAGDVFVGRVPSSAMKTAILLDLTSKGVECIPTAVSQMLSGSKVAQAMFLVNWMIPGTKAILGRRDLLLALNDYVRAGIGRVVTKQDRGHCGQGLRFWPHLEEVYNFLGFDKKNFPFVIQPCIEDFVDLRVVLVGSYVEAYQRKNPCNFRQNLALGGSSEPFDLDSGHLDFCRRVMQKAGFPYAHLDLMLLEDGNCYLSEIALNGGIRGGGIGRGRLDHVKRQRVEQLLAELDGI